MKTRASPCSYRKEKSFCSSVTRSTLSSERKRSFSLLPVSRFLASTLAKAPPLPGLTWLALVTTHRPPLCCRTMPGLMVLALIFMRTVGLVAGGRQAPTARAWRAKSPGALADKPKKSNGAARRLPDSGRVVQTAFRLIGQAHAHAGGGGQLARAGVKFARFMGEGGGQTGRGHGGQNLGPPSGGPRGQPDG